jgi:hypothetical protein
VTRFRNGFRSEINPRHDVTHFIRVPTNRWLEQLRRRDADALDLGIMVTLVGLAQQHGGVGHRHVTTRLRELHELLNLGQGERTVSNRLKKLRKLNEIAFETTQGQRNPWPIAILPDDYFLAPKIERPRQDGFEVMANLEAASLSDFEVTSHNEGQRASGGPATTPLPGSELRTSYDDTAPDQNKKQEEKNPNHDSGRDVRHRITHSLGSAAYNRDDETRQWTERFLALLPPQFRNTSARTGIGRRVAQLDLPSLENVLESFRRELDIGDVRKPPNYLYKLLRKEIDNAT